VRRAGPVRRARRLAWSFGVEGGQERRRRTPTTAGGLPSVLTRYIVSVSLKHWFGLDELTTAKSGAGAGANQRGRRAKSAR